MAQTLDDLVTEANSVFPDSFILAQYQLGEHTTRPVELLARYLVAEMRDLYSLGSSDRENLNRFITNLDAASAHLVEVSQWFRELRKASLS